jgi:Peptidase family M23
MILVIAVALAQLVIPVALLAWLASARFGSRAEAFAVAALAATWLLAVALVGFWFVLPGWLSWLYGAGWIAASARAFRNLRHRVVWPSTTASRVRIACIGLAALACATAWAQALAGRAMPAGEAVQLAFPLRGGRFVVANGGSSELVNAHLETLDDRRFARVRGQSYAVDIVAVNAVGVRAEGILPPDPSRYVIFGLPVHAPCAGVVSQIENTLPDLSPPRTDPRNPAGNRVMLDCGDFMVLLAHLGQRSVTVRAGQRVAAGEIIGAVGNSGNSDEPHLHVHAQRRGSGALELGGEPLAMRFDGRFLVRNDRVRRP